ncbi:MAG: DUF2116 family Zn-ribbon domain-containing protein [Promethearchaeota archaeon]
MSSHSSKYAQYKDKNTIYPHRHCTVCNNMVPEEDSEFGEFCSLECSGSIRQQKKGKKKKRILMFGFYGLVAAVFIIVIILTQPQ